MSQTLAKPVEQVLATDDAKFESLRQAWKDIGLSTQPTNRKEAEASLKKVYEAAGLELPGKIVWCGSPLSQALARSITLDSEFLNCVIKQFWKNALNSAETDFKNNIAECFRNSMRLFDTASVKQQLFDAIKTDVRDIMQRHLSAGMHEKVRASVTDAVWDSAWKSVWEGVGDSIWHAVDQGMQKALEKRNKAHLEDSIKASLKNNVGECVKNRVWENAMDLAWANIRNGIGSQIRVQAWECLWKSLQTSVWENVATPIGEYVKGCGKDNAQASCYGQHDAYWLAFYAYFREVEGLTQETESISELLVLAKLAGWFAPHAKICWISERPTELQLDKMGRLHAAIGHALTYPDGWSLDALEGIVRPPMLRQPVCLT